MLAFYGNGTGHHSSIRPHRIDRFRACLLWAMTWVGNVLGIMRTSSVGGRTDASYQSSDRRTEWVSLMLFWAVACIVLAVLLDQLGFVHLVPALVCLSELLVFAAIAWAAVKIILSLGRR